MIKKLNQSDIGSLVTYTPYGASQEVGKIKSYDNKNKVAWVVYKWDDKPDEWQNYTSQATNYSDLKFAKEV